MKTFLAMICALTIICSAPAGAFCNGNFTLRDEKVCGPVFSVFIQNSALEQNAIASNSLFGVSTNEATAQSTGPSVRKAFYPARGTEDHSSGFRIFSLRKENYMVTLVFPLSSLEEQYEALKLLIEERRKPGASNSAPGALP